MPIKTNANSQKKSCEGIKFEVRAIFPMSEKPTSPIQYVLNLIFFCTKTGFVKRGHFVEQGSILKRDWTKRVEHNKEQQEFS